MTDDTDANAIPPRAEVFPVGPPVDLDYQVGRIGDIERLTEALRGRDHMVLSDVRRAGKSTVALGALDRLGEDTPKPVIVSLNLHARIDSGELLGLEIARQVAHQRSHAAEARFRLGRTASGLWHRARDVPVKDLPDPITALIAEGAREALEMFSSDTTGVQKVAAALDAAERLAADRETQAYVFIDEVQELTDWSDSGALLRELHARLRRRGRRTTFVVAGSEESMLERMFGDGGLLEFDAQQFILSPIEDDLARADLRRSFGDLRLQLSDGNALDLVVTAADGRLLRMMLIANKAARISTEAGENAIDQAIVAQAVREAREDRLWRQGGSTQ